MSAEKSRHEAKRWLSQAQSDNAAAQHSANGDKHEWACFQAQQAAEKALKAAWFLENRDPWGHSLVRLVREHGDFTELREDASLLDQYYIPTRYPNGLPDLTPHEVYTARHSIEAIKAAARIIKQANRFVGKE